MPVNSDLSCPLPHPAGTIQIAHGGGGRASAQLFERFILPALGGPHLRLRHDGAEFTIGNSPIAFTTDSYVVQPLFFPGGDIGKLAVYGTANDLAMCGARPLWLSLALIAEEGLPFETLSHVLASVAQAAGSAGVQVVTGDTKVVGRGKGDGLYVNTSGIGLIEAPTSIGPAAVRPGDAIVLNGDLGRHGIAVLSVREGLEFEGDVSTDAAPLWPAVESLLQAGIAVHCLRDLTRGGLSSALNEIAATARTGMVIQEEVIPVSDVVRGACELLGLDPLHVANEGRFIAIVPSDDAGRAAAAINGVVIGEVVPNAPGRVVLRTAFGSSRVLDMLSGEQLPRIC